MRQQTDVFSFMRITQQPTFSLGQVVFSPTKNVVRQLNLGSQLIREEVNKELLDYLHTYINVLENEIQDKKAFPYEQKVRLLAGILDGAVDAIYVILWTLNTLGIPIKDAWDMVQKANMAKGVRQDDGSIKVIKNEHGKVQKPEGWRPPNIEILIEKYIRGEFESDV